MFQISVKIYSILFTQVIVNLNKYFSYDIYLFPFVKVNL